MQQTGINGIHKNAGPYTQPTLMALAIDASIKVLAKVANFNEWSQQGVAYNGDKNESPQTVGKGRKEFFGRRAEYAARAIRVGLFDP